ncbi:MAG: cytochrome oxidase subunit III [Hyphomicrobiales bacterium]
MKFTDRQCVIAGWVLFILSALGFIISSLRSGDMPSLIGGVLFLVACIVFLVPYMRGNM